MNVTLLRAKIHRATVTRTDLDYEGSLSLDADLLAAAGLLPYERVEVVNVNTGGRFATYAIPAPAGSGVVGLNGGAARLGQPGDLLIILAYGVVPLAEAGAHRPRIVHVDARNRVRGAAPAPADAAAAPAGAAAAPAGAAPAPAPADG